jgi:DNA-binding GntR family transcriptional regulator
LDPISHADVGGGDRVRDISDYRTLTAIVLSRVREMILGLELQPGQKISQEHLSLQLGVSRMPVREALKVLESEGLVKYLPHRGVVVTEISIEDVRELGIIRQALEGTATEIAARNMDSDKARELQRYLDEMDSLGIPPSDLDRYLSAHKAFHLGLCSTANLPRLAKLVTSLWEARERYRRACTVIPDRRKEAAREHRAVLNACVRGDGKLARALLEEHLRKTTNLTAEVLERNKG